MTTNISKPSQYYPAEEKYLVSSSSCHIPSLDPFAVDIMKFFHRRNNMIPLSYLY